MRTPPSFFLYIETLFNQYLRPFFVFCLIFDTFSAYGTLLVDSAANNERNGFIKKVESKELPNYENLSF